MIQYLKRNELNTLKYDACIEASINSRIYAYSWYLDIVADNWDVLVLNDYEAVMPLPWRKKYFIKYVYPPAWIQQLGVFSSFKIDAQLSKQFILAIPNKFRKITIQFNFENDVSLFKTEKRVNYILPLDRKYEEIYKNFRNDRKGRLNQVIKSDFEIKRIRVKELIDLGKNNYSFLSYNNQDYSNLIQLEKVNCNNNNGLVLGIFSKDNLLLGGSFFVIEQKRITYLYSVATKEGKHKNVITAILNYVIEQNAGNNKVLDFEGSMNIGIANFFKSFGAEKEYYYQFQKWN